MFCRRSTAPQLLLSCNQANIKSTFLDSTLGGDAVFVDHDTQAFIDHAPEFATTSEVKTHMQFFDADDCIVNLVHLAEPSASVFEEQVVFPILVVVAF